MKILITGSRKIKDRDRIIKAINTAQNRYGMVIKLLHGGAKGADKYAKEYANSNKISQLEIKPDYKNNHPKTAPLIRNIELVKLAEVTVAIYAGNKRTGGTKQAADETIKAGKPLLETYCDGREIWTLPQATLF